MSAEFCLTVLRAEVLQWNQPLHSSVPDPYVEVRFGNVTKHTRVFKESVFPVWNEPLTFSFPDDSAGFEIQIIHRSSWFSDSCIGGASAQLSDLIAECHGANGETCLSLSALGATKSIVTARIFLHLEGSTEMRSVERSVREAVKDVQQFRIDGTGKVPTGAQLVDDGVAQLSGQGELYLAIGGLLSKLETFRGAIDVVSEIDPYLNVAWTLTSSVYKAVEDVFQTDKKLVQLVRSMESTLSYARDLETLPDKAPSLQQPIEDLLKQTIECCLFVRQYTSLNFLGRLLDTEAKQKIDEFERALDDFRKEIDSGTISHSAVVSSRVLQGMDQIIQHQRLSVLRERLAPASFNAYDRPVCLAETRKELRRRILEWVFSETEQNVFWLFGVAGSGKSTVSTTIASQLREMSRLGAFLFFERGKSDPSTVIRTVAYKLALFDSSIGSKILSEIEGDKDIATASSAHQFNKLLLRPLHAAAKSGSGPIAIVLDGLDECGTPETRKGLMELLQRDLSKLPRVFRFLISSRKVPDIDKALTSRSGTVAAIELDYTSVTSQRDVLSYIHAEMHSAVREQVDVPAAWPWDANMALLGKAAGGLFVWASTAVKMIKNSDDPFYRLDCLVADSRSLANFGLNELYSTVLRSSGIDWESTRSRNRFEKILALLLLSKVPLSIDIIDGFLGFQLHETSRLVLSKLGSLLTYAPGEPVSLFHASFSDYLTSPERSDDPWFIDISEMKKVVAERCLSVMQDLLKFNICGLESSSVRNDDVPGLADRVKANIKPHLRYSCLYWTQHLLDIQCSPEVVRKVSAFAYERLLFWFEVLSLHGEFGRLADRALLDAATWIEPHDTDVAAFFRDASKLAGRFVLPVTQSTPHIYVSMLPLSENESQVSDHYLKRASSVVRMQRRGVKRPPMYSKVLEGHSEGVWSVALSSNRRHIASASCDGTIRVRNVDNMEDVFPPLVGHSGEVTSVSFSRDGKRIVSGSWDCTIRVWDGEKGDLILCLSGGHDHGIRSVTFSPNGSKIASGSADGTVVIWDAETGEILSRLYPGHSDQVQSVAFSPDGTRIVSGSDDGTIIIWDVVSGKPILGPLAGHFDEVNCVDFSPDGKYVTSGSTDSIVKVWDAETGDTVLSMYGHVQRVTSVAYSPCGTRIVSASDDKSIIVWDAQNGHMVSGPFKGHSDTVWSVAWFHDGRYIASGSADKTVRIWDSTAQTDNSETFQGHDGFITCVAFSPDGSRIASASNDGLIIVWDSQSGDVALGPIRGHESVVTCVAFSSDNLRLISGSDDNTIRFWDARTGTALFDPLYGHTDNVTCFTISPDNSIMISGSEDKTIIVWDVQTRQRVSSPRPRPLCGHSEGVRSVVFSPNGKVLASGARDGTVVIWDTESWQVIKVLRGHTDVINTVCFSPDGTRLYSGSEDGTIISWNVEKDSDLDYTSIGHFRGHQSGIWPVVVSRDGRYIISGSMDSTIRIWDTTSRRLVCEPLEGHASWVLTVAISPDGSRLASGAFDNTIRVWDVSDLLLHPPPPPDEHDAATVIESKDTDTKKDVDHESSDWILGDGGWIIGVGEHPNPYAHGRNDLLLWIPPDLRLGLLRPRNTAVFSCGFSVKIDFRKAALGERWMECFSFSTM